MGLQLTISKGLQQGREFLFEQDEVHIGRTPDNDVVLQDTGVSSRHVRISDRLGRYFLHVVDSGLGTQVNNKRLTGEQELRNGDRISLGGVELVFTEVVGEDDATRPFNALLHGELPGAAPSPQEAPRPAPAPPPPPAPPDDDATRPIRRSLYPPRRVDQDEDMLAPPSIEEAPAPPVVARPEPEPEAPEPQPAAEPQMSTRVTAPPGRRPAPVAEPEEPEESTRILTRRPSLDAAPLPPRSETQGDLPVVAPAPAPARSESRASLAPARPEPRAPVKTAAAPASVARAPAAPSSVARASSSPPADGLSAADRARRRRELGDTMGGQFQLWWSDLSKGGKAALIGVTSLFLLGGLGGLAVVFRPHLEMTDKGPEPKALGIQTVPDSFGLGEGVKWEHEDLKAFDFEFVAPTRAVVVVHYQASGISKEEVSLSVNAVNVGWVPPDTTNSSEREIQQILSPTMLKRNESNRFVFDNERNPPGHDSWRIWNLRVEVIPVPDLRPEELLATAREYVAKARAFYDRRDVGAENLSLAWENFRSAWITLEALDDKPDLYQDVRYMLGQVSTDLDQKCGQLMLDFQRNIQFKDRKRAARVLEDINRRFPTTAHRCHNLAAEKASEYGL